MLQIPFLLYFARAVAAAYDGAVISFSLSREGQPVI